MDRLYASPKSLTEMNLLAFSLNAVTLLFNQRQIAVMCLGLLKS
jgi:hypothetical protein